MGMLVKNRVKICCKRSPRRAASEKAVALRAAIEKAEAGLRCEYEVREERRSELDYLAKGGNPLDFFWRLNDKPPKELAGSERQAHKDCDPEEVVVSYDLPSSLNPRRDMMTQQAKRNNFAESGSAVVFEDMERLADEFRQNTSICSDDEDACMQDPNITDASGGNTSSHQEDESTMQDGSQVINCMRVDSV